MPNAERLNVYLSSPFMEFEHARKRFLQGIKERSKLYDVTAMEDYTAKDISVLDTCIAHVNRCNVYVLLLGDTYGSIPDTGENSWKSYTYWEYETAKTRKLTDPNIEQLIILKRSTGENDIPALKKWKSEIGGSGIQTAFYTNEDEIPQIIVDSLDAFSGTRVMSTYETGNSFEEKVYLCNREDINSQFTVSLDNNPIKIFKLSGREDDCPHYFIKRKEIEFRSKYKNAGNWKEIEIQPVIDDTVINYDTAERFVKAEILNMLEWEKFEQPDDVTPEGLIEYMDKNNIKHLYISWFIDHSIWANETFIKFITLFYQKYNGYNAQLKSEKRIFIFGILSYVQNEKITADTFFERIKNIKWGNDLKLKQINKQDIKSWMRRYRIEEMETKQDELIGRYVGMGDKDLRYYKDVETGLRNILKSYNQ